MRLVLGLRQDELHGAQQRTAGRLGDQQHAIPGHDAVRDGGPEGRRSRF